MRRRALVHIGRRGRQIDGKQERSPVERCEPIRVEAVVCAVPSGGIGPDVSDDRLHAADRPQAGAWFATQAGAHHLALWRREPRRRGARVLSARALVSMSVPLGPCRLSLSPSSGRQTSRGGTTACHDCDHAVAVEDVAACGADGGRPSAATKIDVARSRSGHLSVSPGIDSWNASGLASPGPDRAPSRSHFRTVIARRVGRVPVVDRTGFSAARHSVRLRIC
jgi:hypothetical protein